MAGVSSLSGTTRYTRVVLTVGEVCTRVERRLLDKFLTDGNTQLAQHLANKRSAIQKTNNGRINHALFFPSNNLPNLEDWDISAICFIITDFSSIPQQFKDDIVNLRDVRNKIFHCACTELDERTYLQYQGVLRSVVDNAIGYINDQDFRQEIEEVYADINHGRFEDNVKQHLDTFRKCDKIERGVVQELQQIRSDMAVMMAYLAGFGQHAGYTESVNATLQMTRISNEQEEDLSRRLINLLMAKILGRLRVENPDDIELVAMDFLEALPGEGIRVEDSRLGCVRIRLSCENQDVLLKLLEVYVSGQMTEWFRPLADVVRKMPGYEEYDNKVVLHRMDYVDYMVRCILQKLRTLNFAYRWTISVHGHELDIYKTDRSDNKLPKELIDTVKAIFTDQELCLQFHTSPLVKPVPVWWPRRRYEQSLSHKESSSLTEFTVGQMKPSTESTSSPEFAVGQMKPSTESTSSPEYGIEKISLQADKSTSTSGKPTEQAKLVVEGVRFNLEVVSDSTRLHILPFPLDYPYFRIQSMRGKVIVADCFGHTIHMIEKHTGRTVTEMKLPSEIGDMARVSADLIAITLPIENTVQFVSVSENKLSCANSVKVNNKCRKLACTEDLVFVGEDRFVDVFTLKGEHINTITTEDIFEWPGSFAATSETFYISNPMNRDIRQYSHDGERLGEFYDPWFRIMSLLVTNDGHLLCMDGLRGVLSVFTEDMKLLDAFGFDIAIRHSSSICYNETDSVLDVIDRDCYMHSFKLIRNK